MRNWMRNLPHKGRLAKILVCLIAVSGVVSTIVTVLFTVFGFKMAKKAADAGTNVLERLKSFPVNGKDRSHETRLTELQNLYDRRLISTEEYEAKRKEILEEL